MTSAAPYDATVAAYDDSAYSQLLRDSQPRRKATPCVAGTVLTTAGFLSTPATSRRSRPALAPANS
jgi:hypothetical protein